jgi:hypothetical protein
MINQDLRWVPAQSEEGEAMMILQYSCWDIYHGGYLWKQVPYINVDGSPISDNEDEEPPY